MARKRQKGVGFGARREEVSRDEPWISSRTGLIVMTILSLALAVYTGWQLIPSQGVVKAVLWGLGAGVAIWAVFFFMLFFNRSLRK